MRVREPAVGTDVGHVLEPTLAGWVWGPSVRWLWKEEATEAVLSFLRDTRVGCISTRRKPREEDCDGMGQMARAMGKGVGQAHHRCNFFCLLSFFSGGEDRRALFSFVFPLPTFFFLPPGGQWG